MATVPLEATLNAIMTVDKAPYKKQRLIQHLASSSVGLQHADDDLRIFVDAFILEPVEDNIFFRWSSYPGSWKQLRNHIGAISALNSCAKATTFTSAFGEETCTKIQNKCSALQQHFRVNAKSFEDARYGNFNLDRQVQSPVEDDDADEIDYRARNETLHAINADLLLHIKRLEAKIDVCYSMFDQDTLKDPYAMFEKIRELLKI